MHLTFSYCYTCISVSFWQTKQGCRSLSEIYFGTRWKKGKIPSSSVPRLEIIFRANRFLFSFVSGQRMMMKLLKKKKKVRSRNQNQNQEPEPKPTILGQEITQIPYKTFLFFWNLHFQMKCENEISSEVFGGGVFQLIISNKPYCKCMRS